MRDAHRLPLKRARKQEWLILLVEDGGGDKTKAQKCLTWFLVRMRRGNSRPTFVANWIYASTLNSVALWKTGQWMGRRGRRPCMPIYTTLSTLVNDIAFSGF